MDAVVAQNTNHLLNIIRECIDAHGARCSLNHVDVSNITDMHGLFNHSPFNGDISGWDVSNVTNMSMMFTLSRFNGDISGWNTCNVQDMSYMFMKGLFQQDISSWSLPQVENARSALNSMVFCSDLPLFGSSLQDTENLLHPFYRGAMNESISRPSQLREVMGSKVNMVQYLKNRKASDWMHFYYALLQENVREAPWLSGYEKKWIHNQRDVMESLSLSLEEQATWCVTYCKNKPDFIVPEGNDMPW